MKRAILFLGVVALIVLAFIGVVTASESYVISEYSGTFQRSNGLIVNHSVNWTKAPENPNVVYVAVWAPKPYDNYLENALAGVVRERGLTPIVVNEVSKYDLKGRVVIAYFPVAGVRDGVFAREVSLSGILYYSYAGDAKSAVTAIENGLIFSEDGISQSAERLCLLSGQRLTNRYIANLGCGVAYWWHLKARVGSLSNDNPYEMIAKEIASQLDQFLMSP